MNNNIRMSLVDTTNDNNDPNFYKKQIEDN